MERLSASLFGKDRYAGSKAQLFIKKLGKHCAVFHIDEVDSFTCGAVVGNHGQVFVGV